MRMQFKGGYVYHLGQRLLLPSGDCLFCHGEDSALFGYAGKCPVCNGSSIASALESELESAQNELDELEREIKNLKAELEKATSGAQDI